jgi:citrate lyase subunit beta/citryl-CoA lyase
MTTAPHPRDVLFEDGDLTTSLPVCDHYSGVEARMRKSLELQAELGPVFDVTLDGEDGAKAGGEVEHAHLIAELVQSASNKFDRVGARIVPHGHPAFGKMLEVLLRDAGPRLAYLMIPKPRDAADFEAAVHAIDRASRAAGLARDVPLHALVRRTAHCATSSCWPRIRAWSRCRSG